MFSDIQLTVVDWSVMGLYILFLLGLGLYYKRFAHEGLENYFLGGRDVSGFMSGVSYSATTLNADVAPAYSGMTVITGVFVYWWYISRFSLALMIGGILFAIFWRKLNIFTSPEFYGFRFHGRYAHIMRSWVALRSAFIAVVAWSGAGLLGIYKVTEPLFGWGLWEVIILVVPVILIYVSMSGFKGVIVSDFIQSLIIIFAGIVLAIAVMVDFGGPTGLYDSLMATFGDPVLSWHPPSSHELLGAIGVLAWAVGTSVGYGGDVAPMAGAMEGQRILSCKNAREASKMYIWTQVVLFLMLTLLVLPSLGAMVNWPGLHTGEINMELAYGMLLVEYLPAGLLGLAIIAMMSSIMSTISSNMNFGSQVFLNDIYSQYIKPDATEDHYMRIGKWAMYVIVAMAITVAVSFENVIDIAVFMLGLSSTELTANWAQWWWWRFNGKARIAASFGGPLIFLVNYFIVFEYLIILDDATYVVILTSIALTCALWITVALLTKPDPDEVLIDFYKKARPLGWWGDIPEKAGIEERTEVGIKEGFGIAILGSISVSSAVIALANCYVAQWSIATIALSISIITGLLFYRYYGSWMDKLLTK
jgi:solute:Na+ symporter, SSS family